jgi:hypothetical protein
MIPEAHPIPYEQAQFLLAGDLGDVYRSILQGCCAPIFWFDPNDTHARILNSGTLTFVHTPDRLFAITAAHVMRGYLTDLQTKKTRLQVMNAIIVDPEIIAICDDNDIATIAVNNELIESIGKEIRPLTSWPPRPPREDRGIMLAGYPGVDRIVPEHLSVDWGLFTALGVARRVTERQLTWVVERDHIVQASTNSILPPNHPLGGISGGPLIAFIETANHLSHYVLAAIVSQAHDGLENVVAKRADCIRANGTIDTRR